MYFDLLILSFPFFVSAAWVSFYEANAPKQWNKTQNEEWKTTQQNEQMQQTKKRTKTKTKQNEWMRRQHASTHVNGVIVCVWFVSFAFHVFPLLLMCSSFSLSLLFFTSLLNVCVTFLCFLFIVSVSVCCPVFVLVLFCSSLFFTLKGIWKIRVSIPLPPACEADVVPSPPISRST